LVRPHTYGAVEMNRAGAQALSPVGGIGFRAQAIHAESWIPSLVDGLGTWKYETYEEHFQAAGLPTEMREIMPLYKDGFEFWDITLKYVDEYVNIFYADDKAVQSDEQLKNYWADFATQLPNGAYKLGELTKASLIKQLTHAIFFVTGDHTFCGHVEEYVVDPIAVCERRKGQMYPTVQSGFTDACIVAMTSPPMPHLVNDWAHIHEYPSLTGDKKVKVLTAVDNWQAALRLQSDLIDARNQERKARGDQPFDKMNPRIMDCSVSV